MEGKGAPEIASIFLSGMRFILSQTSKEHEMLSQSSQC